MSKAKARIERKLRAIKTRMSRSVSLSSGGCSLCETCTRKENLPCCKPDEMRYSMDAFGFDLTAITKELFHIEILWCKDSLPEYFTLIHALLSKESVSESLWKEAGLSTDIATR